MVLGDRIKERLACLDKTQAQLARAVGVSPQAISKLVMGGTQESPKLYQIARFLQTTPEYLLGITDDPSSAGEGAPNLPLESHAEGDQVLIDSVDLAFGMGGAFLDSEAAEITKLSFPLSWLRTFTESPPHLLLFGRGIGDSMVPTIHDNDGIFIDRGQTHLSDSSGDRVWAIVFGGLGMLKRLRAMPDGTVKIMSDNPVISDEIASDDELFIVGRVVGKSGRL